MKHSDFKAFLGYYPYTEIQNDQGTKGLLSFIRRQCYVIKFLKAQQRVMRVCRNVRITVWGHVKTIEQLKTTGFYPQILYHQKELIRLNLYVHDSLNRLSETGSQIHRCYKRRMQIEHGFRDIKTGFGFGSLILNKPTKARINLLWLLACLSGLLFIRDGQKHSTQTQRPIR